MQDGQLWSCNFLCLGGWKKKAFLWLASSFASFFFSTLSLPFLINITIFLGYLTHLPRPAPQSLLYLFACFSNLTYTFSFYSFFFFITLPIPLSLTFSPPSFNSFPAPLSVNLPSLLDLQLQVGPKSVNHFLRSFKFLAKMPESKRVFYYIFGIKVIRFPSFIIILYSRPDFSFSVCVCVCNF